MSEPLDAAAHRQLAVALFNRTWDLLDEKARQPDQDAELLHAAHASRHHWAEVARLGGPSGPKQAIVGDWQLSRVYAALGMAGPSQLFGQRSLDGCGSWPESGPFLRGFAHEALARAARVAGDAASASAHEAEARAQAAQIEDAADRGWLLQNLADLG